ncbi:MAG: Mov34/MPN/PAD-1 family protein [Rubrobacteraceae bacterium]|nr:Mov34/MPN/PAD-1 family protein [Rubrobacteraceae bacterium]
MTEDIEFWSEDRAFGLKVPSEALSRMLELSRRATPRETGGVLVGYYTEAQDCAVVTEVSRAPPDSRSGKNIFVRGTAGLQRWLNKLWLRERRFYLGDWHSHPGQTPRPSLTDMAQLEEIAEDKSRKCPEPVALLIGGAAAEANDAAAFVYPKDLGLIELLQAENTAHR